jgi:hypothetical protein
MKISRLLFFSVFALLLCCIQLLAQETGKTPVVVELFTSEGCSSCPPADALLSELKHAQPVKGVRIIPLEFHVDYWNHDGWTDKFSSAEYTQRQEGYAVRFKKDGPYTPQMVVDGATEFVGNNARGAYSSIVSASDKPKTVEIRPTISGNRLHVDLENSGEVNADVMLAIVEDNLETKISGGENRGKVLRHNAVVRDLRKLGSVKNGPFSKELELPHRKDWKQPDLQAVVFLQERNSGRIIGAASIPLNSVSADVAPAQAKPSL